MCDPHPERVFGLSLRIPLLVILVLAVASDVRSHEFDRPIPVIQLGRGTQTPDGFRLEVESGVFRREAYEPPNAVPMIGFTFRVPIHFARLYLGLVFLEVTGPKGDTSLEVLLDHRKHGDKTQYLVSAERSLAEHCAVHFEYKAHPDDEVMTKDYVVRLKYHLPKQ